MKQQIETAIKELQDLYLFHQNTCEKNKALKLDFEAAYNGGKAQAFQMAENKLKEIIGIDWRKE